MIIKKQKQNKQQQKAPPPPPPKKNRFLKWHNLADWAYIVFMGTESWPLYGHWILFVIVDRLVKKPACA